MLATDKIQIALNDRGAGWSDCAITVGPKAFVLEGISDTTDVLGDPLRAALEIATGGSFSRAGFDREPHEWRLLLTHRWEGMPQRRVFRLRVLEFEDIYACEPDEVGHECFTTECNAEAFVVAVRDAVAAALANNRTDEFSADSVFRSRALAALNAAIAITAPLNVRFGSFSVVPVDSADYTRRLN
ncbi:MAG: hypothetical protein J7521_16160 [Caulobacter sp.]|nr:hypothetical protein [Caulobacter sp.]